MTACRLLISILSLWAVVALADEQVACAAGPTTWQPYREPRASSLTVPMPARRVATAQFTTIPLNTTIPLTMPHEQDTSVDAITDADLERLRCYHCDEPLAITGPYLDPVLVDSRNRSFWPNAQSRHTVLPAEVELLPSDVIWHSYWAGAKEPRTSVALFHEDGNSVSLLDISLGGRTSILRSAVRNPQELWQGWEVQIEGAAILRLNLDEDRDFDSTDFRFGVPLILARNRLQWKLAYYHLSSHVGDEFLIRNPGFQRINFSRDVFVFGASYFPRPAWRWYGEVGWAFRDDEGSEPLETQFGVDYAQPGATGKRGTPFLALNGHLREEVHFGGSLALQAGWLWRGQAGRTVRTGLHYYNGKSTQFEFFDDFEQHVGIGLWQEY